MREANTLDRYCGAIRAMASRSAGLEADFVAAHERTRIGLRFDVRLDGRTEMKVVAEDAH